MLVKTEFQNTETQPQTNMQNLFVVEQWVMALEAEANRFKQGIPQEFRTRDDNFLYWKSLRRLIKRLNEDLDDHIFRLERESEDEWVVELDGHLTKKALDNYCQAARTVGIVPVGIRA